MTSLTALLSKWPVIRQIRQRADGTGLEAMSAKTRASSLRVGRGPHWDSGSQINKFHTLGH